MGISFFTILLKQVSESALRHAVVTVPNLNRYAKKTIVLDTNQIMHRTLRRLVKDNGGPITHRIGEVEKDVGHLKALLFKLKSYYHRFGIELVCVFDGKPHPLKKSELEKRSRRRKVDREKLEKNLRRREERRLRKEKEKAEKTGIDDTGIDKDDSNKTHSSDEEREIGLCYSKLVTIGKSETKDCMALLKALGIPSFWAECEADVQCASIARSPKVYAAMSDDSDLLAHGAPILIRRVDHDRYEEIHLYKLIKGLGLDVTEKQLRLDELDELNRITMNCSADRYEMEIQKYLDQRSYLRFVDLCILLSLLENKTSDQKKSRSTVRLLVDQMRKCRYIEDIVDDVCSRFRMPEKELIDYVVSQRSRYLGTDSIVTATEEIPLQRSFPNVEEAHRIIDIDNGFEGTMDDVLSLIVSTVRKPMNLHPSGRGHSGSVGSARSRSTSRTNNSHSSLDSSDRFPGGHEVNHFGSFASYSKRYAGLQERNNRNKQALARTKTAPKRRACSKSKSRQRYQPRRRSHTVAT